MPIKEKGYTQINIESTLSDIMKTTGYVLPEILEVYVISKKSGFYPLFKTQGIFIWLILFKF